jgi:hypothetical protein
MPKPTLLAMLPAAVLSVAALLLAGCEKPLFPKEAERSPYERYNRLHGSPRPTVVYDAYGNEQPALRERLRPMDQP